MEKLGKDPENRNRLAKLAEFFTNISDWTDEAIGNALTEAAKDLGVKKGALMFPARVSTSGQNAGPDLLPMIEVLGKDRALARISETLAKLTNG